MKRILIVDDHQETLDMVKILMELQGYETRCLNTGTNLADSVVEYNPNLILLDIMLGDLDGRDLCDDLKNNPKTNHIPIIMISGSDTIYLSGEKVCPAETFISKPFDINYLITQIETYVS